MISTKVTYDLTVLDDNYSDKNSNIISCICQRERDNNAALLIDGNDSKLGGFVYGLLLVFCLALKWYYAVVFVAATVLVIALVSCVRRYKKHSWPCAVRWSSLFIVNLFSGI